MELGFVRYFLPEDLLAHFDIKLVKELGEIVTKQMILEIYLEEKNQLPEGCCSSEYESKGFSSESRIQDFPKRQSCLLIDKKA